MEPSDFFNYYVKDFHNDSDTGGIAMEDIYQHIMRRLRSEQNDNLHILFAEQALMIKRLKRQVNEYHEGMKSIQGVIYQIGGPLNDNKLKYTVKQMADFQKIMDFTI